MMAGITATKAKREAEQEAEQEAAPQAEPQAAIGAAAQPIVLVVDTNVWLDMLVFDDPRTRRLASLLCPSAVLVPLSSEPMRAELADVIGRPQFRLDTAAQAKLLARYDALVTSAPVALDCRLPCRDPDDRKFLDLAIGRRTSWLLSRDRALLAARKVAWSRFEVRIGQVADFYNWLDDRLKFLVTLDTSNPNDVDVPLTNVRLDLTVFDVALAHGTVVERQVTLPSRGSRRVPVEFAVPTGKLLDVIARFRTGNWENFSYRLAGSANWGNTPFGVPFERSGNLDVLKRLSILFGGR